MQYLYLMPRDKAQLIEFSVAGGKQLQIGNVAIAE